MSGDSIKVSHEVLGAAAGQLAEHGSALEASRLMIENAAVNLAGAWQGSAAEAFMSATVGLLTDLAVAVEGVDVLSGKLSQADATFTDADLAAAGSIQGGAR